MGRAAHPVGYESSGDGPLVVLVHSSVSGRRQWQSLTSVLEGRFRVVAIDLIGYSQTPAWTHARPQQLSDQSALIHQIAAELGTPAALVGPSFGGGAQRNAGAERVPDQRRRRPHLRCDLVDQRRLVGQLLWSGVRPGRSLAVPDEVDRDHPESALKYRGQRLPLTAPTDRAVHQNHERSIT